MSDDSSLGARLSDPSFILKPAAAKDLIEFARDMQAIVDGRAAAIDQPLSVSRSELGLEEDVAPAGQRAGVGSASILPYLQQSIASRPKEVRTEDPSASGGHR